ncbi:MAG: tRNA1(Val) (adenine(37)-N6)-methyltransferase [Paracoccaceae bacterium]
MLGGRVRLLQPREGYRAATDPVLLAAAVAARPGDRALDLGCGVGAAALCLAARVPGLTLMGLEREPAYVALARRNAALNASAFEVIEGDVAAPPPALRARVFDHVLMNPPWFAAEAALPSPVALKDAAHREQGAPLAVWIDTGLRRLVSRGRITVIQRTERLPEILAALAGRAGAITVKPLAARHGRAAKRVIVEARKDVRGPLTLAAPIILHGGPEHVADGEDFTPEAAAILREGGALSW